MFNRQSSHSKPAKQQHPVSWPAEPVVARAYIDQLLRSGDLDEAASVPALSICLLQVDK